MGHRTISTSGLGQLQSPWFPRAELGPFCPALLAPSSGTCVMGTDSGGRTPEFSLHNSCKLWEKFQCRGWSVTILISKRYPGMCSRSTLILRTSLIAKRSTCLTSHPGKMSQRVPQKFLILLIRPALETPNGGTELLLGNSCLDIRLRWLLLTEHQHMVSQRGAQDYDICFISCNVIFLI